MTSDSIAVGFTVKIADVPADKMKTYAAGWDDEMSDTIGHVGVVTWTGELVDGSPIAEVKFAVPIDDYWVYLQEDLSVVDDDTVPEETSGTFREIQAARMYKVVEEIKVELKQAREMVENLEKTERLAKRIARGFTPRDAGARRIP